MIKRKLKMDKIRIYILAIKYYFNGDNWEFAIDYAKRIINGFKKH